MAIQVFNAPPEIHRGPISIDSLKPKEPEYAWPHRQILPHIYFPKDLKNGQKLSRVVQRLPSVSKK